MQARRLLSTVFAVALISTSCATSSDTAAAPPPPPVDETINTVASFPDDGLTRLILTPIAGAPVSPTGSSTEDTVTVPGTGAPLDISRLLTPEMVAQMPPGASLEARDGTIGYVDADGQFVELEAPAPSVEPEVVEPEVVEEEEEEEVEIEPLYGDPYIDALAADPSVEAITVIGDGTFGVTLSDPSIIDPTVFAVVEDVPLGITTDQYEGYQWYLENNGTNLDRVQPIAQTEDADLDIAPTLERADGKGIVVAVIDSGVDFSHPDLQNSEWNNLGETCGNGVDDDQNGYVDDCNGWDFANNDATPYNLGADAHGTHVAGIITSNRDRVGIAGVAPDARIMDLNVAQGSGSNLSISGAAVTAAIRYAVDNGADIINMSIGSQPGTPASAVTSMGAAIDYAAANGVVVVVAAGNNNVDLSSLAVYPASFNRSNMLVVGASTPSDTRASFSNYSASIVDVYAPGELILSTVPGPDYRFMSGTSQASPATAATVALAMQTYPDAAMSEIIDAVTSTTDHKDALASSTMSGRVNAAAAIGEGEAPPIPTELQVAVSGLLSPSNEVSATVDIVTPPAAFDEGYQWELSLIYSTDDGAYAIIDHPFLVDGVETVTGENGALQLASADATSVAVGTNLPAGRYSFVIEAVPTADASFRLGEAFVTTFEIAADDFDGTPPTTAPVDPDTPVSTAPTDGDSTDGDSTDDGSSANSGTTPTTGGDSSSTTAPNGGGDGTSSPTTTAPAGGGGNSTTTAPAGGGGNSTTTVPANGTSTTTAPAGGGDPSPTTTAPAGGGDDNGSPTTTAPAGGGIGGDGTGGGDPSPTTTAPAGGGDDNGSPTTTPIPTGPAPAPDGLGSGVAKKGAWESTSVAPQAGYVGAVNTVTIRGNFPSASYVWFGDQPGQVVHQNRESITVRTPLRATPGIVDITIQKSRNGVVLRIPAAYAFVEFDGDGSTDGGDVGTGDGAGTGGGSTGDGSTGGAETGGDTGSGGGSTGDGGAGGGDGSTGDGGTGDGGSDEGGTPNQRRARMTVGVGIELANGLRGASVTPNLAANTPICSTDPCQAVRR